MTQPYLSVTSMLWHCWLGNGKVFGLQETCWQDPPHGFILVDFGDRSILVKKKVSKSGMNQRGTGLHTNDTIRRHPRNRKYITYHYAAGGGPSHGRTYINKKLVKIERVVPMIRSCTDKQTNTHTHRHTHHSTPVHYQNLAAASRGTHA